MSRNRHHARIVLQVNWILSHIVKTPMVSSKRSILEGCIAFREEVRMSGFKVLLSFMIIRNTIPFSWTTHPPLPNLIFEATRDSIGTGKITHRGVDTPSIEDTCKVTAGKAAQAIRVFSFSARLGRNHQNLVCERSVPIFIRKNRCVFLAVWFRSGTFWRTASHPLSWTAATRFFEVFYEELLIGEQSSTN